MDTNPRILTADGTEVITDAFVSSQTGMIHLNILPAGTIDDSGYTVPICSDCAADIEAKALYKLRMTSEALSSVIVSLMMTYCDSLTDDTAADGLKQLADTIRKYVKERFEWED